MATIKIISGTYGFMKDGIIEPKTPEDKPFEVSQEEAERLIGLGVAAYDMCQPIEDVEPVQEQEEEEEVENEVEEDKPLEAMSFKELKTTALEMGLDIKPLISKALLIEAIKQRDEELAKEDLPDLSAETVVD